MTQPEAQRAANRLGGMNGSPCPKQVAAMQRKAWASTSKRVILTHIDTGTETTYESLNAAARAIGGSAGALCHVIKGDRKSHKGYKANYEVG